MMKSKLVTIEPLAVDKETAGEMLADVSESTIDELMAQDSDFPKLRQISKRRVGFLVIELREWAFNRPISKLPPPANTGAKKRKLRQALPDIQKAA